jgi:putative DNA primase/helicase
MSACRRNHVGLTMALGFDFSSGDGRLDDRARDELRGMAEQIARSFLGEPNRRLSTKRQLRWHPKGSLALYVAGDKTGLWYDHAAQTGGDIIELIRQQRGCSIGEAIDEALTYLGPSPAWSSSAAPKTSQPAKPQEDDAARINRALRIWSEVQPVRGTLAEQYLARRGIQAPDEALDVLGFHWHCPFDDRRAPALVALVQDIITGEPIAIHRRELTPDAGAADKWKALGPKGGGAIRLMRFNGGDLAIGEGVETCLAGMMLGSGPAWSVIDAGGMTAFPVLDHVSRLTIMADNDVSETGQRAAAACRERWAAAGKAVRCAMPEQPGQDFNDVLLTELATRA